MRFDTIPSGNYRISITKDGFDPFERTVSVNDKPVELSVVLKLKILNTTADPNYVALRGGRLSKRYAPNRITTVSGPFRDNFKIRDEGKPRQIEILSVNRTPAQPATPAPPVAVASARTLPGNVFSNRNAAPPPVACHSTVILLDGMNGWFDNFAWSQKAVIGLLDKVPADERIAVYAITKYQGLVVVQNYTNDHQALLKAVGDYVTTGLCQAPPGMGRYGSRDDGPPIAVSAGIKERRFRRFCSQHQPQAVVDQRGAGALSC